ncbi:Fe-S cluster assembly protein SufD [Salibacter sp.]|uniref:Fe-S cluster assembly protein SufD n=1 Tax=Salibacter sp. TaxID=2010995 RepID=UPI00286FC8A6|nr:Fe-S cluster assembly protein SufD [Salibacter sp.]MDR9397608.1 Fe-S cluster assembly protein SufD [Salibacter sp.]MDR9486763.1 Fe-S cluster assembly protein SufD [Salibacter sp.]
MSTTSKKDKFIANFMKNPVADAIGQQQTVREEAFQALRELEFPTLKDEAWKYTRVAGILNKEFEVKEVENPALSENYLIPDLKVNRLVFINGKFQSELSEVIDSDLDIKTTAQARFENHDAVGGYLGSLTNHKNEIFTALNTAFNQTGAFVQIQKNKKPQFPVHIIDVTEGEGVTYQPRNLFVLEEGAELDIIHTIEGDNGQSFTNLVNEFVVKENAKASYYQVQRNGEKNNHIQTTQVYQAKNSRFKTGTYTFGGKLVRNNVNIAVDGENCETILNGAFLLNGKQHVDNHTFVDHLQPHCESHENYKGIIGGKATGVFNGKVLVRPDSQKINAFQSNQNILLTEQAEINSKPELEIYADDVKCSHGSTTGQMDEEALFYLMSRGMTKGDAMGLMIQAFAAESIDIVEIEPLKQWIESLVEERCKEIQD